MHRRDKDFDSFSSFECDSEKESLRLEALAIMKYKPIYNSQLNEEFKSINMIKKTLMILDVNDKYHDKRFIKKVISSLGIETHVFNINPFVKNEDADKIVEFILGECNE